MLRISLIEAEQGPVTLRLEGRLLGPWVAELQTTCEQLLAEHRRVRVELAEVSFVDRSGLRLLTRLRSQGAVLDQCSPFIAEELKAAFEKA